MFWYVLVLKPTKTHTFQEIYCKRITFDDVFFLAPLSVESLRQIKYIGKCAFINLNN